VSTIEERLIRLEVPLNLTDPPKEWIIQSNIDKIVALGYSEQEASNILIKNFGNIPSNLRYFINELESNE